MKLKIEMDRVITFHPILAKAFGGINTALFFQQLYYWSDKGTREDGYIYKTAKEIEEETTLSYYQQKKCQKKLIELGILNVKKIKANGVPTLHFKLNIQQAQNIIDVLLSKFEKLKNGNSRNLKMESEETSISLTEITTEITNIESTKEKEIKKEKEKSDPSTSSLLTVEVENDLDNMIALKERKLKRKNKRLYPHAKKITNERSELYKHIRDTYGKGAIGMLIKNNVPIDFVAFAEPKIPKYVEKKILYMIGMARSPETFAEYNRWKSEVAKDVT